MAVLREINDQFHLDIFRGDTSDVLMDSFQDENGDPVDLSSLYSDARLQIRWSISSNNVALEKSLGDGIEFVADSSGNANAAMLISIPATESAKLIPGKMSADLELTLMDGTIDTMQTETGNREWIVNVIEDTTR